MKRKLFTLFAILSVVLVSCLDTEEKIEINADETGTYNLAVDMGSMMGQLKAFAAQKEEIAQALQNKDTTINFSSFTDTSTQLTAQEKEVLHDGTLHLLVNEENSQLKLAFKVPFKNIGQLTYLKQHFPEMIAKLKATDKALGGAASPDAQAMGGTAPNPGLLLSPGSKAYSFNAEKNSISNKLVDKALFESSFSKDSSLQMVKQVLPLMGDVNYKTILILPRPAKTFTGNNGVTSDDKKTVTFSGTLSELFEKPEMLDYKVDY